MVQFLLYNIFTIIVLSPVEYNHYEITTKTLAQYEDVGKIFLKYLLLTFWRQRRDK